MNKILLLLAALLLLSGCTSDIIIFDSTNTSNISLWEINNVSGFLEPVSFNDNMTVRVFDLIIESPNSLIIGGIQNGTPFATISATEQFLSTANVSVKTVLITQNVVAIDDLDGTKFFSNINLNNNPNSSAIVGASDGAGNGMIMQKFNSNNTEPYKGVLASLNGNMEILTTFGNAGESSGPNKINIGFYKNLTVLEGAFLIGYNERDYVLTMNETLLNIHKPAYFHDYTIYNQSFISGTPLNRTSPPTPALGELALFSRDDGNLYIKRADGNIRRITTANSGSNIWTEEQKFNNHTYFYGDVILKNSVYNGGTIGYACIDETGHLFKSVSPCHLTSTRYVPSTIDDPTLGEETTP